MTATWFVRYKDGTELHQYDASSPHFLKDAGEVPYRAIDWPNVAWVQFSSQLSQNAFEIGAPPEGVKLSLRSRHFRTQDGSTIPAFMIVLSKDGEEVNDESVQWVVYWFANGVTHECEHFNCSDVAQYALKLIHGQPIPIMPTTNTTPVEVSASIE